MFLGLGDQNRKRNSESPCNAVGDVETGIALSPLDEADMRVVNVSFFGERLLRKTLRPAVLSNNGTERRRDPAVGHRAKKMACPAAPRPLTIVSRNRRARC